MALSSHPTKAAFAREVWEKLFIISSCLRDTAFGVLGREWPCTFAMFPIMQFFFEYPEIRPSMKELATVSGLSSGAVTQAVDQLVEEGLLKRIPSEKDRRSKTVTATEKLLEARKKSVRFFVAMLEKFSENADPYEVAVSEELFGLLSKSRITGEIAVVKHPSDLTQPGFAVSGIMSPYHAEPLPVWLQLLHFTSNMRGVTMVYYYNDICNKRGRMTLGKLRILDRLFYLSGNDENPMVKDLADEFHVASGVVSQTLNAMIQDGIVERVPSDWDRRVIRIRLTPLGLSLRRRTASAYTRFMQNFFDGIEPEKAEIFNSVLGQTLAFLKNEGKSLLLPGNMPRDIS